MKLVMLALRDVKVMEFMTPFAAQSVGAAVRSVSDLVNGGGSEGPAKHPEDFSLWQLAYFDTSDGQYTGRCELVAECVNLKTVER